MWYSGCPAQPNWPFRIPSGMELKSLTGFPIVNPASSATSSDAIRIIEGVIDHFGIPNSIRCNRNPFDSALFRNFCKNKKIRLDLTPA
ncbi:hypothetical protein AYI69_g10439 [Smittium culicis]|uniref:Uncharacterized protein n=1 Tax=Smittium culicis TaxID=133412 RepID=A0A1R1X5M9_9FUNG|nr:hypothetical protein AYI69_g10439 [Smittium culicis]